MTQNQPHDLITEVDLSPSARSQTFDSHHPAQPVPLMIDPIPGNDLRRLSKLRGSRQLGSIDPDPSRQLLSLGRTSGEPATPPAIAPATPADPATGPRPGRVRSPGPLPPDQLGR